MFATARRRILILSSAMLLMAAGCGSERGAPVADAGAASSGAASTAVPDKAALDTDAGAASSGAASTAVPDEAAGTGASLPSDQAAPTAQSLCERLCGRYSHRRADGEFDILELVRFGSNLYGLGGTAASDVTDGALEAYSFWAMEFIPEAADGLSSVEAEECRVGILTFSSMSNLSRYWGPPSVGTLRQTAEGIELEGFAAASPFDAETLNFQRDERPAPAFPYLQTGGGSLRGDLIGLWRERSAADPLYVSFTPEGNVWFYQKSPGKEVFLGGGACQAGEDGTLTARYSLLENGGWTLAWEAEVTQRQKASLVLCSAFDGGDTPMGTGVPLQMERIGEDQVPVVTLADVAAAGLDDSRTYDAYAPAEADLPFHGVWVQASRNLEDAKAAREALETAGFDTAVVFSPDWAELNREPFFCVSAGRCASEEAALALLERVKQAGYADAYIRATGERIQHTATYTIYDPQRYYPSDGRMAIRDAWVEDICEGEGEWMTLYVDEETVFDETADLSSFGQLRTKETPLAWLTRCQEEMRADPEGDAASTALCGVFQIQRTGGHINRFFKSFWWD